ncbi:MAG: MATE family efflux transporter [Planctomycetes bacterium]|nr:MATE family efflux transporter [Planctomycetota bacterium]
MTRGNSITKDLFLFALPMLVGNMLQSCYNMVDMAIVGRYVGRDALAAVSNTAMLCFISNSICIGFTIGGTVLVAKYRGAGDPDRQRDVIQTLFALSAFGGIVLTILNYFLYRPIIGLMGLPAEALPYALEYMDIVIAGNVFVFGYNAACAVLRGFHDSRRPVYAVAVAAVVNTVLDFALVGWLQWGVGGAAVATVLAQALSCGVAVHLLHGKLSAIGNHAGHPLRMKIRPEMLRDLLRLGLPTALHSAVLNVSYMIVTAMFNQFGTTMAAAAGVGLKVNTFVAMPCWAVGHAVTAMAGHAMGGKRPDLAATVARKGILIGMTLTGALLLLVHLFIRPFLGLFSTDPVVVDYGVLYLRTCCSFNFLPYVVMFTLNCFAVGVDAPLFSMANSLLQSVALRLGLSFLFTVWMETGFLGLCLAEAASPLIPCLLGLLFFYRGNWRRSG